MSTRIHTKIAATIAAALVIPAVVAPRTSAGPSKATQMTIPPSLARLQEPGSTGYVPKTTLVTTTAPVGGGLDWISALIGAGAGLGIAVTVAGGLMALRKRPTLAEEHRFGTAAANSRDAALKPSTAVTGSDASSTEYDEQYLMAAAESMLRAGYGERQIERALRRMSPSVSSDSGRLGIFGSLRRSLACRGRISRRRPTQPVLVSVRARRAVARGGVRDARSHRRAGPPEPH
jgi:hypothetical protein